MRKIVHPQFPDYFVRDDGLVERRVDSRKYQKAGDILAGRVLSSGYRQFKLLDAAGNQVLVRANRLVCEAFNGPPPSADYHAAHDNGVRLDNRPENLFWRTAKQNKADSIRHQTAVRGRAVVNQHGHSKLSDSSVAAIRDEHQFGLATLVSLAAKYGVGTTCIGRIVSGQSWRHVRPARSALARRQS